MEITQLRYFLEVARTEHVTKSARHLRIAQPALTQAMHRLESELGVALFDHVGRNIRLTPVGAYLKEIAEPVVAGFDAIERDVRDFADEQARTVTVGVLSASTVAVEGIAAFSREHPDVAFRIVQSNEDGSCDVTVTTELSGARSPRAAGRAKAERGADASSARFVERIGVAVPALSDYGEVVELSSLSRERFVCLAGSRLFRGMCDELCRRHGFAMRIGFESDNPAVVHRLIGLGQGVGFWPERSWGALGDDARFAALAEGDFERAVVVERAPRADDAAVREFYEFFVRYLEDVWRA